MSKISKIYDISNYLYGVGKRKGKRKKDIENSRNFKYYRFKGNRKAINANSKLNKHIDDLRKLSSKEKLERIKNKE